jgi:NAD(P)-dependent dehydrogenase (short-subunit alcohol dehydrogenase family)
MDTPTTTTRTALVTGANKGIGKETARDLAARGFTVLLGARDHGRGTAAVDDLRAGGADAHVVQLDVTDEASVTAAATSVTERFGRLDILVNNAGISDPAGRGLPSETPLRAVRNTFDVNVFGVLAVTNAFLPLLRRSPAGRIVNVSSGLGTTAFLSDPEADPRITPYTLLLAYNSSKAALNAITLMYATELKNTPMKVVAVSPGFCATDLNDHRGVLSAAEGGAAVARLATLPGDSATGAFLEIGVGTVPW